MFHLNAVFTVLQIDLAFRNFQPIKMQRKTCHYHGDIVQSTWQLLYRFAMIIFNVPNSQQTMRYITLDGRYKCIKT